MRLIDADALKAELEEFAKCVPHYDVCIKQVALKLLFKAPTIDAEPVRHGYWRGEADGYVDGELMYDTWYCSECYYCIDEGIDDVELLPNYCPDCGAKMGGGRP